MIISMHMDSKFILTFNLLFNYLMESYQDIIPYQDLSNTIITLILKD